MQIEPIAIFRSPLGSKFGVPRQSGVAAALRGRIVFLPAYRSIEALRGLDGYDYLWLLWHFSANSHAPAKTTVRPPLLGGNTRMGVFATRSPFRPNPIGLSSVRLERVELDSPEGPVLYVSGADLMDGTPIFDIKPYLPYTDSHPEARGGFTDSHPWPTLHVDVPSHIAAAFAPEDLEALRQVLAQDPRPRVSAADERVYGLPYLQYDVRFVVSGQTLLVVELKPLYP